MPRYKCTNDECRFFDEIVDIHSTKIVIRNGEAVDVNQKCNLCGSDRVVVREPGMTTNIAGTNDQRNRMLNQ